MEKLLELNKNALYAKLDAVQKIKDLWVAADVIMAISSRPERDKCIIANYTADEIKIYKVKRAAGTKLVRMFTIAGLARYMLEGKVYDYQNACMYFNIPMQNLKHIEYKKYLESIHTIHGYQTNILLKWLFGRRKMCKALPEYTTIPDVIKMFQDNPDVILDRMEYLKKEI